eukprot:scaffold445809_cov47-Prasinocladus_malaysianus.AAC.1
MCDDEAVGNRDLRLAREPLEVCQVRWSHARKAAASPRPLDEVCTDVTGSTSGGWWMNSRLEQIVT